MTDKTLIEQYIETIAKKLKMKPNTRGRNPGGYNQKKIAEKVHKDINERLSGKVVTKISLLKNYCPAEEYHQKYLEKR